MIFLWGPVFVWMGVIFFLSNIPSLTTHWGLLDLILRKLAHIFEYTVLTALLLRAIRRTWTEWPFKKMMGWTAALSCLYAISDEWHQSFVPGRNCSFVDVMIDSLGIVLAISVLKIVSFKK